MLDRIANNKIDCEKIDATFCRIVNNYIIKNNISNSDDIPLSKYLEAFGQAISLASFEYNKEHNNTKLIREIIDKCLS